VKFALIDRKTGFGPVASWVTGATVCLGVLFGSSTAFAAPPPANTVIGNQASASYSDTSGNLQLATSNIVQTLVQQVGSFDLDTYTSSTTNVVNTKTGAAGATVYAPHVLTNTGNGSDNFVITVDAGTETGAGPFSKIEVFADVNGDGVPDSTTSLCSPPPSATTCTVPAQSVAGNNGKFQFVVAYTLPSTATTPTDPYNYGTVTATVVSSTVPYTSPSAADRDNVNLTTEAAFNVTKAIGVPAVTAPGGGAWPKADASGKRSESATCPATWSTMDPAHCQYTVYTLNVSNTGGNKGTFVLQDQLPSGMTYVANSAVWSSAPGVALGDGAGGDPTGIDYQFDSATKTITAVITDLGPNVSQTISFMVLVNNTAAIGTSTTTNTAMYNPTNAPGTTAAAPGDVKSPSNPAPFTVLGTYSFAIGTNLPPGSSTAETAKDSTPGLADGTADTTTVATAVAGSSVQFPNRVFNTGNATDAINLTIGTNDFPAGTTFAFFAADGVTPLLDTTGDGIPDTGPIAAGASVDIVVRATLPATAVVGSGAFQVLIVGTSAGEPTLRDATKEVLTTVIGSLVDLTNSAPGKGVGTVGDGDLGPGPSPLPTTTNTTDAGKGTIFDLFIRNNDTKDNAYVLAASQSPNFPGTLPAGWTVKFVAAGGTCDSEPIPGASVSVDAGQQVQVEACVTPPATQAPVTAQKIYFQVKSTSDASTGATVSDVKTDAVTVTAALTYGATLTPNNNGQVAPGGTVVYPHTLTNTGSQTCNGPYTVKVELPADDVTAGWTTALYIDVNGDGLIDDGDTLVTGPITSSLGAGEVKKLLVKVFAPGGATAGATDTGTVTVTFNDTLCGTPSATDISTVITGQVRVVKTQAEDKDCDGQVDAGLSFSADPLKLMPGQCVIYQVVATNEGSASVTNLMISDTPPAYTSLADTQPPSGQKCLSTGVNPPLDESAAYYKATAAGVSCGSTSNKVDPMGSATLRFSVQINK